MRPEYVMPRRLWQVDVHVADVLDLRANAALVDLELERSDLSSAVGDYAKCQAVARAANQLGLHGVISPAPEGGGETLAVFVRQLGDGEYLTEVSSEFP